jgi:hypothetical protein
MGVFARLFTSADAGRALVGQLIHEGRNMTLRRIAPAAAALTALVVAGATAAGAGAAGPHVCSGKFQTPGLLKGTFPNGVIVKGVCAVRTGKAHVIGNVTVTNGAALGAVFGRNHSSLTVTGNVIVDKGGIALLGCKANPDGTGFPCVDDPSKTHPTLTSHVVVTGSIIENSPLGVIVHNSTIGRNVTESGGGGGLSCAPPSTGVFAAIMSPVYSDYEDSSVGGNVSISGLSSCWLGLARVKVHGNVTVKNNVMGDPDAIEIVTNNIGKNLSCRGNSHPSGGPPGAMPVWNSAEANPNSKAIYPRISKPNTVGGKRSGQCVKASPVTLGGPPAASTF